MDLLGRERSQSNLPLQGRGGCPGWRDRGYGEGAEGQRASASAFRVHVWAF